jgi:hypothetical protein
MNEIHWVTMSLASAIETTFETLGCSTSSNSIVISFTSSSLAMSVCSSTSWRIRFCSSTILNSGNCSSMTRLGCGMPILTASAASSSSCVTISLSSWASYPLITKPHLEKHFWIVSAFTIDHDLSMNLIASKIVNFLTRSDACSESLMLSNMDRTSDFRDNAFRFQMMPALKGWRTEVRFGGK